MKVALLSNQGLVGGGEVMLLAVADALRSLGHAPLVVGPSHHPDVLIRAHRAGHAVAGIRTRGRAHYLVALRRWARRSDAPLLWANGMLPATATSGMPRRIVHLHQVPSPRLQPLVPAALHRATAVIVPSQWVAARVPGAQALPNWTADQCLSPHASHPTRTGGPLRVGFLGRTTEDKGIHDLIAAANTLVTADPQLTVELHIGGETRFSNAAEHRSVAAALKQSHAPVIQHGWVEPSEFLAGIDVLAVPSNWGEAFGLVAAEALSAGVPVLVSDDGALPEVVGPHHDLVVRAGDADDLARGLRRVAHVREEGELDALVQYGRRRWEEHFSPATGQARIAALMTRLEDTL